MLGEPQSIENQRVCGMGHAQLGGHFSDLVMGGWEQIEVGRGMPAPSPFLYTWRAQGDSLTATAI